MNPREFVATGHLYEALLDRFELLSLGYQSEGEEEDPAAFLAGLEGSYEPEATAEPIG